MKPNKKTEPVNDQKKDMKEQVMTALKKGLNEAEADDAVSLIENPSETVLHSTINSGDDWDVPEPDDLSLHPVVLENITKWKTSTKQA